MCTGWPLEPTVTVTTWPGASELCRPACVTVTVNVCGPDAVPNTASRWQGPVAAV